MKTKTHVKAGGLFMNRCETAAASLAVRTGVRAGGMFTNRCETAAGAPKRPADL